MKTIHKSLRSITTCWIACALLFFLLFAAYNFSVPNTNTLGISPEEDTEKTTVLKSYVNLPLIFEENMGQVDSKVGFLSRAPGYTFLFNELDIVIALQSDKKSPQSVFKLAFLGHNNPSVNGEGVLKSYSNYFLGNSSNSWITKVPHFSRVVYSNLYPGIDAVFYGNNQKIEYDLIVTPGADPSKIQFSLSGIESLSFQNGSLKIGMKNAEEVIMEKPIVYQDIDGLRKDVLGEFVLLAHSGDTYMLGFSIGEYEASQSLVIDPIINYSSYIGGSRETTVAGVSIDEEGNAYITGKTYSLDFPILSPSLAPSTILENAAAFVTKISSDGTELLYSTYLGGSTVDSENNASKTFGNSIAVDINGNAYVTGFTNAKDFPTTTSLSYEVDITKGSAFVTGIDPSGSSLLFSSYLGGNEYTAGNSITVDLKGNVYITGETIATNFPTKNPLYATNITTGSSIAFITAVAHDGSSLIYSTYFGSNKKTSGNAIAVDKYGNAYITGIAGQGLPTVGDPLQIGAKSGGFVAKIASGGTKLIYSSYLGNSGTGIAVDKKGNAFVVGQTSSPNFPLKGRPIAPKANSTNTGFITGINPDGTNLIFSKYLGGSSNKDKLSGVSVSSSGNLYLTGITYSLDFPLKGKTISPNAIAGRGVGFVTVLKKKAKGMIYSTYLGGGAGDKGTDIKIGERGEAYVVGSTYSLDFPKKGAELSPDANPENGVGFITTILPYSDTKHSRHKKHIRH